MAKRLLPIAVALTVMLAASAGNAVLAGFAGSLSDPVSAPINGGYLYGEILSSGDTWGHAGVDWSISSGGTVRAATAGTVSYSGVDLTLLTSGTAVGGGSNYIILASTASSVNGAYNNKVVHLSAGTGAGQSRIITSYEGATRKAYISSSDPWNPIPNTTTSYRVGTYADYGEYIRLSHSSGSYYTLCSSPLRSESLARDFSRICAQP